MTAAAPPLALDHVVIGVADLEASAEALSRLLGRGPSWRGRHPTYGTANVLYRLDNAYLELLAPDIQGEGSGAWTEHLRGFLDEQGEGLFAVAFSSPDVDATVACVRRNGLRVDDAAPGEGVDLTTGAVRRWSNARIPPPETPGTSAFFIQHHSPAGALPVAPFVTDARDAVSSVPAVSIESADIAGATRIWGDLVGLPHASLADGRRFDLANGSVYLWPGAGVHDAPHRWRRLVLATPDLPALIDRFAGLRLPCERGDFPEGRGLRAECCGADILIRDAS
jgi:hypothetical protein